MHVSQLVQQKLSEFGLEQRDLADAAEVTESYISQLLNREKMPPAPDRIGNSWTRTCGDRNTQQVVAPSG